MRWSVVARSTYVNVVCLDDWTLPFTNEWLDEVIVDGPISTTKFSMSGTVMSSAPLLMVYATWKLRPTATDDGALHSTLISSALANMVVPRHIMSRMNTLLMLLITTLFFMPQR